MSYHRTGGKGGTRNSARTKHIDEYAPNFNKRQGSGRNPRGKKQNNPAKRTPRERYDRMMAEARGEGRNPPKFPNEMTTLEKKLSGGKYFWED